MPLMIDSRMEDGIAILELEGSLTLGPSLVSLRNAARDILSTPKLNGIILDVQRVSSIDSSGLGELTIVYSSASRHSCPMRLVGVSSNLQKMLQMTHLDAVLASADQVMTAKRQIKTS
jgi:anti-anti-sigma factor